MEAKVLAAMSERVRAREKSVVCITGDDFPVYKSPMTIVAEHYVNRVYPNFCSVTNSIYQNYDLSI